ncbi:MAG: hypothetical protein P8J37_13775 [Fuerstiella sp.]|nr:hypothetical protein [Fuerstiella sp.]
MGTVSVHFHKLCSPAIALTFVASLSVSENANAAPRLEELARKVGVTILADATSGKDVLASTRKRIPYRKMSRPAQVRAAHILDNVSQYRRMPSLQYPINPDIYQYLINHPDVAISTWRVMGISTLQMWQTDEFEYEAKATDGSTGTADILWRDGNQCLFVVEGKYQSPLLPGSIEASALVWLQFRFVKGKDGSQLVNQQVETFLYFPSAAIDTIAKLTSRLTNSILDRNVFEVSLYARMMTKAAEKEPQWIQQLAQRMDGVPPERLRELALISRRQNPTTTTMRPVSTGRPVGASNLPASGEFHAFEMSLQQVVSLVPVVPNAAQRSALNSQPVDADPPGNLSPDQIVSLKDRTAVPKPKTYTRLAVHYGNPHPQSGSSGASSMQKQTSENPSAEDSLKSRADLSVTQLTSPSHSCPRR